jgi:hypothetical protein
VGGGVAVAFALDLGGDEQPAPASASTSASERGRLARRASSVPAGCTNLKLSATERSALERRVFGDDALRGSVYLGACNGRLWAMARFESGGDGVFADVRASQPVALGSIAEARCEVPYELLSRWRQADGCGASELSSDRDEPRFTPAPEADDARPSRDPCDLDDVPVPNYNPLGSTPDQRLPRPEELLPPRERCPERYEETRDDNPQADGQRRYPNGRTYIEQVNFCNLMRDQGVPCTVPPPP